MSCELLHHPFMSRAALEHFGAPALIEAMLAFELALAARWACMAACLTALDALAIAADKIAGNIILLAQSELQELAEPAGDGMGGSSPMAHKHNPVRCALIRAASRRIHGHVAPLIHAASQPLERAAGEWHSEWTALIDTQQLLEGALEQLAVIAEGLEVHGDAMAHHLAATLPADAAVDTGSSHAQIQRVLAHLSR